MASDGKEAPLPIEGGDVKKLLGTFWFRAVFPRLSGEWRARLLEAFAANVVIPNHVVRVGRHGVRLNELSHDQLKEIITKTVVKGPGGPELQLLLTIANLWGTPALTRLQFVDIAQANQPSTVATLFQGFRS